jgi:predicted Fe-Mo cluster-binding NifX family protein
MRVAISTDAGSVSAHFGRCPQYTVVEIENGSVLKREEVANPGHQPGMIPSFLKERGIECIVAGGMGKRATILFDELGIQTVLGVSGGIDNVIGQLSRGELKGGESLCKPGAGKDYGLAKESCDHED